MSILNHEMVVRKLRLLGRGRAVRRRCSTNEIVWRLRFANACAFCLTSGWCYMYCVRGFLVVAYSFPFLFARLFVCQPTCLYACLSVCLSACLSVFVYVCLSVCVSSAFVLLLFVCFVVSCIDCLLLCVYVFLLVGCLCLCGISVNMCVVVFLFVL